MAVEEHFYLFWPFVIFFASKKNIAKVILGIILLTIIVRFLLLSYDYAVFLFTFTRIDSLAIGAILALMETKNYFKSTNLKYFVGMLGGLALLTIFIWFALSGEGNDYIQNLRYLLLSLFYFSLIGSLLYISKEHTINSFLTIKFLQFTGKISYGLYVYHPLVFLFCTQYLWTESLLLNFVLGTLLSYLIARLSFTYFESQFLKLKKYFEYSSTKPRALKNN